MQETIAISRIKGVLEGREQRLQSPTAALEAIEGILTDLAREQDAEMEAMWRRWTETEVSHGR